MSSAATSRLRPPPPTVDPRPRGTGGPDTARIRPADPGTASRVAAVDDPAPASDVAPTTTAAAPGDGNNPLWVITAALAAFLVLGAALIAG